MPDSESATDPVETLQPISRDLAGLRFGRWLVESEASRSPSGHIRWNCRCDCGQTAVVIGQSLRAGKSRSCGCLREQRKRESKPFRARGPRKGSYKKRSDFGRPLIDLTGQRFGRLVVERLSDQRIGRQLEWLCRCDCGAVLSVIGGNLREGITKSCGCRVRSGHTVPRPVVTHGLSSSREYQVWRAIKQRCYDPNAKAYANYGGRGIGMSDEWRSNFAEFYRDMGPRPTSRHQIERRDNDGGYSKDNCVWATAKEQSKNKRDTILLTIEGVTKPASTWAEEKGMNLNTVHQRLRHGWSAERALLERPDPRFSRPRPRKPKSAA